MARVRLSIAFGAVIRKYRFKRQLSQEALAEKAHIHPTHIGLIERGLRNPSLDVAKALATGLGLSLAELIAEAENVTRKGGAK